MRVLITELPGEKEWAMFCEVCFACSVGSGRGDRRTLFVCWSEFSVFYLPLSYLGFLFRTPWSVFYDPVNKYSWKLLVLDVLRSKLTANRNFGDLNLGHGYLAAFGLPSPFTAKAIWKDGKDRRSRELQTSQPDLSPWKAWATNRPGSHSQPQEAQEGDWEQPVWIYKGQIVPDQRGCLPWRDDWQCGWWVLFNLPLARTLTWSSMVSL